MNRHPLLQALERLGRGLDLTAAETHAAVSAIMAGDASEVVVGSFLTALRVKGETADELEGAVTAVRERMAVWETRGSSRELLDTCGTGGDGASTVNISTAAAIVVAACGVPVAKHGNRSASGNSGSAEVLTELGIAIEADPPLLQRCLHELNLTFLFAPRFHPALRFAAPVRRQLPFRTLFNLVGPLVNPARPAYQLIGASSARQADLIVQAMTRLSIRRAAVVTGSDNLDEVTLAGPTEVRLIEFGSVSLLTWTPEDFGLNPVHVADLRVSGPTESAQKLRALFAGASGPIRNVVLANSSAALWVVGQARSPRDGVAQAAEALDSGRASRLLERWGTISRGEG